MTANACPNAYVLPKAVLPRVLDALAKIRNLDVRSAANALMHVIGRYHTGTENFGRFFVLCREDLAVHPAMAGHSEWHIRLATKELQNLGIIRKVDEAPKAQFKGDGRFRKKPTWFALNRLWAVLFPAALRREQPARPSPECRSPYQDSQKGRSEASRVHSGEPVREEQPQEPQKRPQTAPKLQVVGGPPAEVPAHLRPALAKPKHEPELPVHLPEKDTTPKPRIVPVEDLSEFDRQMMAKNADVAKHAEAARLAQPTMPGLLRAVTDEDELRAPEPEAPKPEPQQPKLPSSCKGDWISRILDKYGIYPEEPDPDDAA